MITVVTTADRKEGFIVAIILDVAVIFSFALKYSYLHMVYLVPKEIYAITEIVSHE